MCPDPSDSLMDMDALCVDPDATKNQHRERPPTSYVLSNGSPPFALRGRMRCSHFTHEVGQDKNRLRCAGARNDSKLADRWGRVAVY